jgi:16S rRNA processing protein RimM
VSWRTATGREVVLGRIAGAHGVRGWLRVKPFTDDVETLLGFPRWLVGRPGRWQERPVLAGRRHGPVLLARLEGIEDRDAALALRGEEVALPRGVLPEPAEGEFYWDDLVGLAVQTCSGTDLGRVERIFATGANDVLVVQGERERLIPFVVGEVVIEVDLDAGRIRVDWDPEF